MKIKSVSINNFLVIGEAKISLDDRGLVLVQGDNKDDGSANSNGAGKSSLVDAISWCLFGITARGVTGDEVVNNKIGKNCRVSVDIDDDGTLYQINRFRKHRDGKNNLNVIDGGGGELTCGTTKLTQELIDKIVGCSSDVFNAAVYAGQEQMPDLPGMTDKALKTLIEESAGIQRLQTASVVATRKAREAESAYAKLVDRLYVANGRADTINLKIKEETEKADDYLDEIHAKLVGKESAYDSHVAAEKYIAESLKELRTANEIDKSLDDLSDDLNGRKEEESELANLSADVTLREKNVAIYESNIKSSTIEVRRSKAELDSIEDKVGTPCSDCGKPYHKEDMDEARQLATKKLKAKVKQLRDMKAALESAEKLLSSSLDERKKFSDAMTDISEISRLQSEYLKELSDVNKVKENLAKVSRSVSDAKAEVDKLNDKKKVNPHTVVISALKEDVKALAVEIDEIDIKRKAAEDDYHLAKDAVEIFGRSGVRAHILDTVTPFLNEKTGEYLSALTDGNITAVWSTLSKTAKGELREKFGISVQKESGSKTFKGLSGGEKRKVRIATSLALQDLVAGRASKPISLFLGDEIDDALDEAGLERLMGILEQKAKEKGTVLVISHNSLSDWINQEIVVTNVDGVSTVSGAI